jgi:hypothetical protein
MKKKTLLRRKMAIQVEGTKTTTVAVIMMTTVKLKQILNTMILPQRLTSPTEMLENLPVTQFV